MLSLIVSMFRYVLFNFLLEIKIKFSYYFFMMTILHTFCSLFTYRLIWCYLNFS